MNKVICLLLVLLSSIYIPSGQHDERELCTCFRETVQKFLKC